MSLTRKSSDLFIGFLGGGFSTAESDNFVVPASGSTLTADAPVKESPTVYEHQTPHIQNINVLLTFFLSYLS